MRRWGQNYSEEEIQMLKELAPTCSQKEIAFRLQRSTKGIQYKLLEFGIKKRRVQSWTEAEVETLRELAPTTDRFELAKLLNRHPIVIFKKLHQEGIKFKHKERKNGPKV